MQTMTGVNEVQAIARKESPIEGPRNSSHENRVELISPSSILEPTTEVREANEN